MAFHTTKSNQNPRAINFLPLHFIYYFYPSLSPLLISLIPQQYHAALQQLHHMELQDYAEPVPVSTHPTDRATKLKTKCQFVYVLSPSRLWTLLTLAPQTPYHIYLSRPDVPII